MAGGGEFILLAKQWIAVCSHLLRYTCGYELRLRQFKRLHDPVSR